jgi:phenylalanyl-tRNA synthetase beta chain
MKDDFVTAVLSSGEGMLSIATPPSPDEHYIRSSLLPNLCKAVADNLRFFSEFAIFESAQLFFNRDFGSPYDSRESLPLQRRNTAGAYAGNAESVNQLFRKAKGVIEALPRYVHVQPIAFDKIEKPVWADDVLWLNIIHNGERIGNLALLSKKVSLDCGIKNSAVMLFEFDIDSIKPYPSRTNKFKHLPEYPMIDYDLSLLFDLQVKWEEIYKVITGKNVSDDLLQDVSFVDEYRGHQIQNGKKSVTLILLKKKKKKTLTSEEIESCANAIVKRLNKTLGAELRS